MFILLHNKKTFIFFKIVAEKHSYKIITSVGKHIKIYINKVYFFMSNHVKVVPIFVPKILS